ncbi:UDP-2,4-diacetamido-2,4,6-trideoxy-beta-L-altropyranose hydrolase [Myxococcota bacterium]|nr:UDP-2,4-diacetamido-2,4,6-trideoxy-beta-L-altropyranose hydrolase [Myxococcota bacterium]
MKDPAPFPALLVRADAGPGIGAGHVMRGLALGQAWADAGGRVEFLTRPGVPELEARLRGEGFGVHPCEVAPGRDDAALTGELALRLGAGWVAADGYAFDAPWQEAVRASGARLLVVDDYGHAGEWPAEVVLNPNLGADPARYGRRAPHTRLLLGPRFALLRREFLARRGDAARDRSAGRRLLVTLGGSDPADATSRVLDALDLLPPGELETTVVLGAAHPRREVLRARLAAAGIRGVEATDDMAGLMAWADMAVSAGGSTCWELAFMGVPALVLVVADNQRGATRALHAAGCVESLGEAPAWAGRPAVVAGALRSLVGDGARRRSMAERLRALVDGRGAERVVGAMVEWSNEVARPRD